jgi:hypothetical protein
MDEFIGTLLRDLVAEHLLDSQFVDSISCCGDQLPSDLLIIPPTSSPFRVVQFFTYPLQPYLREISNFILYMSFFGSLPFRLPVVPLLDDDLSILQRYRFSLLSFIYLFFIFIFSCLALILRRVTYLPACRKKTLPQSRSSLLWGTIVLSSSHFVSKLCCFSFRRAH